MTRWSAEHGFLCKILSSPFTENPALITADFHSATNEEPAYFFTEININFAVFFNATRRGRSFSWENMEKQVGQMIITLKESQALWHDQSGFDKNILVKLSINF